MKYVKDFMIVIQLWCIILPKRLEYIIVFSLLNLKYLAYEASLSNYICRLFYLNNLFYYIIFY